MDRQAFVDVIAPVAVTLRQSGSPIFPSVRISQAILETGCVLHPWNNLCGFKVGAGKPNGFWRGAYVMANTWEVIHGQRLDNVQAAFRAYDSIADCYRDQDRLFTSLRRPNGQLWYQGVLHAATPEDQAVALYRDGYATDPEYHKKIVSIINLSALKVYDEPAEGVDDMLAKEDADKLIALLAAIYMNIAGGETESHRIANELRKASGQPTQD